MSAPVLVTYATTYGSTREVAKEIATELRYRGQLVDVLPAHEVDRLEGYGGIVLGAPVYIGQWHKDARAFLATHEVELDRHPVAIFALGPLSDDEKEVKGAQDQLEEILAGFPWLKPVATAMFGGRYDPQTLGFLHKLMAALPVTPLHGRAAQDARDWDTIRAWSDEVSGLVSPAQVEAGH